VPTLRSITTLRAAVVIAAVLLTGSSAAAASPAQALPPLPHPHAPEIRPPIHEFPEPEPRLDIPEVHSSNDPNDYDTSVPGGVPRLGAYPTPGSDDDGDSSDTETGLTDYGGYGGDDGGVDLKSIVLIGGALISGASLLMWLRRR
jgi:hypothetical protein